ncbi:MAG: mechanosensitive ion channel family protein [Robiginitalea sp.]|uniref:mechanosensitive ion channel family protein n=1 Tax=Robiginitalea sp. TaxID=1902411 RepID=UPI003C775C6C
MDSLEFIWEWLASHPTIETFLKYLIWVAVVIVLTQYLKRLIRKNTGNSHIRYRSQKIIEVFGYLLLIIVTITYFTGNIKDMALAVGLFTAGITITLQELILSVAGSVYIFLVKVYQPGDRIEINGIKGDVIDIDSVYTSMMEIGQWVSSDNYSGRIVKLSNAFVFRGPVYNYSRDFPFIWDEFDLPVRYGSDLEEAKKIVLDIASAELSDYVKGSVEKWKSVVGRYYIEDAVVEPTLAITLTDNWVRLNLRYIVDYKKRRHTKHRLNELILRAIDQTQGRVALASTTIEIIRVPVLKVESEDEL